MATQHHNTESGPDWPEIDGYVRNSSAPLHPPIDDAVRAPLDYTYTAAEIMNALPRSKAVDASALPIDLQRKAAEHADDLSDISQLYVDAATAELADLNVKTAARLTTLHNSLTATPNGLLLSAP